MECFVPIRFDTTTMGATYIVGVYFLVILILLFSFSLPFAAEGKLKGKTWRVGIGKMCDIVQK